MAEGGEKKKLTAEQKQQKMREEVFSVMRGKPLEELNKKQVRRLLEKKFNMEEGALDAKKDKISKFIQEFVDLQQQQEDEAEEEEAESKPKKRKTEPGQNSGYQTVDVKNIKKTQNSLMTGKEFLENAPELKATIFDATVSGPPRTFTSGNRGWYAGGKVPITLDGKQVYVQVGLNVTVIGSKEWEEK